MAQVTQVKISDLTTYTGTLAGTELFEMVRPGNSTGTSQAVTALQIANSASGLLPTGGTAGQVLSKNSTANFDAAWANNVANGMLNNTRLAKTAAYPVVNADKGVTIALGGTAFYTLTFNAASGYDANFAVMVVNEDSGRGKTIAPNGVDSFILWPGQTCIVYNDNNTWRVLPAWQRWHLPSGNTTVNCDFILGLDTNDGLAAGAGNALKTYNKALYNCLHYFDFSSLPQSTVTILGASGNVDTQQIHYSPHAVVGAQGGAAILLDGNSGSMNVAGDCIQMFFSAAEIQLRRITLVSVGGGGITLQFGAMIYILDGVSFGACSGGGHITLSEGSRVLMNNNFTISGSAPFFVNNSGGFFGAGAALTGTFGASVVMTAFVAAAGAGGITNFNNIALNLNGNTVTGSRFTVSGGAALLSGGSPAVAMTYFPGTSAGTVNGDCSIDNLFGQCSGGSHGDSDYTIISTDFPAISLTASLTAQRTWTLPLANTVPSGTQLRVQDGGGINGANTLRVIRQGSDTFVGTNVAGNIYTLPTIYSSVTVTSNGVSGWQLVGAS